MRLRLRQERLKKVWTQQQLADRSGVSRVTISRLEDGAQARIPTIQKLAAALGLESHQLIEDEDQDRAA